MSNHERNSAGDTEEIPFNGRQCALALTIAGLVAGAILISPKHKLNGCSNPRFAPTTQTDRNLANVLAYGGMKELQGLPIKRSCNREEIDTLRKSGQDGYYVLQEEGSTTVTYWEVRSGQCREPGRTMTIIW